MKSNTQPTLHLRKLTESATGSAQGTLDPRKLGLAFPDRHPAAPIHRTACHPASPACPEPVSPARRAWLRAPATPGTGRPRCHQRPATRDRAGAADYKLRRRESSATRPMALSGFLHTQGHWNEAISLGQTALAAARTAGDRQGEAWTLNQLGIVQELTGDYPAAAASLTRALQLSGDLGDRRGQAWALKQLGVVQERTGDYAAAASL